MDWSQVAEPLKIIIGLLLVLAAVILFFVGLVALNKALIKSDKHPMLQQFVQSAIVMAYKGSDAICDALGERLYGLDKIQIAGDIYTYVLPDCIRLAWVPWLPLEVCWKRYVTKEKFLQWVEREYQLLTENYELVHQQIMSEMLEAMENTPVPQLE